MAALAITRSAHTAAELRRRGVASHDGNAARRMLAIAMVLDGAPRGEAARLCGLDRQTLRDWEIRYNNAGVSGLPDRMEGRGRKTLLGLEQVAAVAKLVRTGPDSRSMGWCAGAASTWPRSPSAGSA